MKTRFLGSVVAAVLMSVSAGHAQQAKPVFPPAVTVDEVQHHKIMLSPPERVGPGRYRIGDIVLDKKDKSISFPAVVNMNKGLLEYLLVRDSGKTHESLFRTAIEPYNLQVACLLLGLEGSDAPLGYQGDPATPRGEPMEISVQIKGGDGKAKMISPEAWLIQMQGDIKHNVPPLHWVYTGSVVSEGRFVAQMSGSIVALYHDPAAMIDNASRGGESDKIWFVREEAVPPVGTPVTITIRSKKQ